MLLKWGAVLIYFSSLSVYLPLLCVPAGQIHFFLGSLQAQCEGTSHFCDHTTSSSALCLPGLHSEHPIPVPKSPFFSLLSTLWSSILCHCPFCQLCSALVQHHHETFNLMLSLLPAISQQVKIIFLPYPPVDTIKSPRQKLTGSVTILSTNSTLFMACKDIYDSKIPATERIILDQALAVKVHRFYMLRYPQTNSRQVFPLPSQECAQILHAQSVF